MSRNKPRSPSAAGSDAGAERAGTSPTPGAAGVGVTGGAEAGAAGAGGQVAGGAPGPVGDGSAPVGGPGPAFDLDAGAERSGVDLSGEGRAQAELDDYAARTVEDAGAAAILGDRVRHSIADAGTEAAATLSAARPQEASRVLSAAAGSASEAPSLSNSGLVDLAAREIPGAVAIGVPVAPRIGAAAGVAPGLMDAGGSHGAIAEPYREIFERSVVGAVSEGTAWDDAWRRTLIQQEVGRQPYTGAKMAAPQPQTPEALADLREAGFDFVVTSRQINFRRAGVVHPTTPTLRRSNDFTMMEMDQLVTEPMLIVTLL